MKPSDIATIMSDVCRLKGVHPDRILLSDKGVQLEYRVAVATQLRLRSSLEKKLPRWVEAEAYVPTALSLEQCSSQATATLKARYVRPDDTLLDLTGGMGVDFLALAEGIRHAVYVELSPDLFEASVYNFPRLAPQASLSLYLGDSMAMLPSLLDRYEPTLIYLDPARREGQNRDKRVYAIEDCTPSLTELIEQIRARYASDLERAPRILVKLSPMLDIKHTLRTIPYIDTVEVVALRGEVKELLLSISLTSSIRHPPITCIDLTAQGVTSFSGSYDEEESLSSHYATALGAYIYEPNSSVMKSGLFRSVADRYQLEQLHPNSHIYTSSSLVSDFPGRCFSVVEVFPFQSSTLREVGKRIGRASVTCRNFPLNPDELRKKLRINDGGEATLIATTYIDDRHVLILATR